jgi:hypothetical protein
MLNVSESIALYRGFAKPKTRDIRPKSNTNCNQPPEKIKTTAITHSISFVRSVTIVSQPCELRIVPRLRKKDSQKRIYATRKQNISEPATTKNQSNGYHSFNNTCKKCHYSMVYRSIRYIGQLRPHHPHLTHHPHSTQRNAPTPRRQQKEMDSRGIEPRTTPMLREYYTTKPRAP